VLSDGEFGDKIDTVCGFIVGLVCIDYCGKTFLSYDSHLGGSLGGP